MHHWLVFVSSAFHAVVLVVGREGERRRSHLMNVSCCGQSRLHTCILGVPKW